MTHFISPIGFSSHRVIRSVAAYGPSTGDSIVLVHPQQPDSGSREQTEQAVMDVEQMLDSMVRSITVETRGIKTDSFEHTVNEMSALLTERHHPVVCLGAGATDITYPLFVATLAHLDHVQSVMSFSDIEKSGIELSLPDLTVSPPRRTTDLFIELAHRMDGPPANIRELASDIDQSEANASRLVDDLVDCGLVRKERREQSKVVELTMSGKLFARNTLLRANNGDQD